MTKGLFVAALVVAGIVVSGCGGALDQGLPESADAGAEAGTDARPESLPNPKPPNSCTACDAGAESD